MSYPQNGVTVTTRFINDANGRRTDAYLGSNSDHSAWQAHEHIGYDPSGRVSTVLGQNGPATAPTNVLHETVCYAAGSVAPSCSTAAGSDRVNIQWVSDTVSGETHSYSYDANNRLTQDMVTGGSNPRTYTYSYDPAGNRLTAAVTGTSPTSQALSFNNANQITTTGYAYDGAGNQTATPGRSTAFNTAGQQTSATVGGVTTTYKWAGTNQNELLSETTPGQPSYSYTYGRADNHGLPEIEAVTDSALGTGYVLHDPDGKPVILQTNAGVSCLYIYDATDNPTVLAANTDVTAVALQYDPYGAATRIDTSTYSGVWGENPYLFHAGLQDRTTGLVKFGARWYDPATGTWTQQDQLNAPLNPTVANRYEYAGDNPINQTDPTGRSFTYCTGIEIGVGFTTVTAGAPVSLIVAYLDATFTIGDAGSDCYTNPAPPVYPDFGASEDGYGY